MILVVLGYIYKNEVQRFRVFVIQTSIILSANFQDEDMDT